MNCPVEIAAVVLEMLQLGTVRIRAFAAANESRKCFLEADHLHNLPKLVSDYLPQRFRYYWECERLAYIRQVPEWERRDWQPLWDRMSALIAEYEISTMEIPAGQDQAALAE